MLQRSLFAAKVCAISYLATSAVHPPSGGDAVRGAEAQGGEIHQQAGLMRKTRRRYLGSLAPRSSPCVPPSWLPSACIFHVEQRRCRLKNFALHAICSLTHNGWIACSSIVLPASEKHYTAWRLLKAAL